MSPVHEAVQTGSRGIAIENGSMGTTIDEFQRHIQALLLDLSHIVDPDERRRVNARLETTLQEVIQFRAAISLRDEVGEHLFELIDRESKIKDDGQEIVIDEQSDGICTKCNAPLAEDIEFCLGCGEEF
jgi:hypothetical protein